MLKGDLRYVFGSLLSLLEVEPYTKCLGEYVRSASLMSGQLLHLWSWHCIGTLWWHVWVCAWLKSRGTQGTIPCWKQCKALCVVWYLIWSKNVYATPVCFKLHTCSICLYEKFLTAVHSERCSPVKTHFDWRWGQMSGEAQREIRVVWGWGVESSPCSLWQNEQEALSKVSVHSQKAVAELQATAWWLYRRVRDSRGGTGKGKLGNLHF